MATRVDEAAMAGRRRARLSTAPDNAEPVALVPGTIVWLPPTALVTGDYQRILRMTRVRKMAREFDTRLVKVLLVTERDNAIYLIDGQHRAAAAIEAGRAEQPLPCLVVSTDSYADEAELFVRANERALNIPVTTGEIFYAKLEQGDPVALGIQAIARNLGLDLDLKMTLSTTADGTLRAIATLQRIYRQGGPAHLQDVLDTIMAAFSTQRSAYSHYVLTGYHQLLYRYHMLMDRDHLLRVARALTVDGLHARSAMRRVSDGVTGADAGLTMGKVLHQTYNENLPARQQLPPWDRTQAVPSQRLPPGVTHLERPTAFASKDADEVSFLALVQKRTRRGRGE